MSTRWDELVAGQMARLEAAEADPELQARRAEEAAQAEAVRRGTALAELDRVGVPTKDVDIARSGTIRETEATRAVRAADWKLLALSGAPGCGKTTAASLWLWEAVDAWIRPGTVVVEAQRLPFAFVTAAHLSRWRRYDEERMDGLLKASRLVIDDLGAEYLDPKGFYLSLLDELINERYANRRPTILTTNRDVASFRGAYGERVADRIREIGRFVSIADKSMRRAVPLS